MPSFLNWRSTTRAMSLSSSGSSWSSISIKVTSTPMREYAEAISEPDAPAPATTSAFGIDSSE